MVFRKLLSVGIKKTVGRIFRCNEMYINTGRSTRNFRLRKTKVRKLEVFLSLTTETERHHSLGVNGLILSGNRFESQLYHPPAR